MNKIIYVPLEEMPQRFSGMMNSTIKPYIDIYLYPKDLIGVENIIKKGEFLDINNTIKFKAKQLEMIAEMFELNQIQNGDIFLIGDIFFPGIESIRYMSELQGIDIKIYGFNYAGRADKTDFVQKLNVWADYSELGYHLICDGVFVGSKNHKKIVEEYFDNENLPPIYSTGYVWNKNFVYSILDDKDIIKEDFVIWPHRICGEKGIDDLISFSKITDKKIVITSCGNKKDINLPDNIEYRYNLTKYEYYKTLKSAKYYLSTAYQETFGYTLKEAILFDCIVATPNRACYNEMVPKENLYNNILEINTIFNESKPLTDNWKNLSHNNILEIIKIINGK